ncbi:hypothetical protein CAEBREN_04193 [Caenorhabditis brenneri]|uniref:Uncharacterized protein n=1 Tax=Caenorhabditis brenneri TaxID=135651 RepID=G0M8Z0_CAEBE|nr:hypothetical protein CAEBREN_04193 [Caenorhabditis brenneri]
MLHVPRSRNLGEQPGQVFALDRVALPEKENDFRIHRKTVIFGDDEKFMSGIFEDAVLSNEQFLQSNHYISQNSPADDLIYSKFHCDTVLTSAPRSTFGYWMGYFSRGDKVYYLDTKYASDYVIESGNFTANDFFLPHWTPLKFESAESMTVVESFK